MQSLQSVIEQLDIRRAQVHVEALIVEVAEGSNINFGVQWASKDAGLMQFANGTQIPIGTLGAAISQAKPQKGSTVISENGATTINPDTNGDLSTLAQLLSGFSGTAVGVVKGDWMALVQAVKNDSSSNVLSTPSITTLDNQEAFFMVGQDVPVLTGSTVGSNNSNPFNTVERKKVGIMLKVTPQINEGNAVQMVIEQEVSKVEGQTSLDVVFGERKLKTTVLANDGELIVLGGLMDDQAGESVAKVPLNANPFTNGHRYLIQQAAAQCDWLHLFLVKEDSSRFPYEDRLDLVLKGTADIPRLTVHRGSEYIISRATFPCYFIKEQSVINHCYTEIDLKIFRQYLAPALGVTHRFVGTEPFCRVTAQYNQDMRYWLETPTISAPPIELVEIERLRYQEMPISASRVRQLLAKNDLTAIAPLVPAVTLHYLQNLLEHSRQDAAARQKTPA